MDELAAESIKDKSLAKRLITNISTMAATLGVLSVLPKLYARSNTAPGARGVNGDVNGGLSERVENQNYRLKAPLTIKTSHSKEINQTKIYLKNLAKPLTRIKVILYHPSLNTTGTILQIL